VLCQYKLSVYDVLCQYKLSVYDVLCQYKLSVYHRFKLFIVGQLILPNNRAMSLFKEAHLKRQSAKQNMCLDKSLIHQSEN
jgi:hypothetical protein